MNRNPKRLLVVGVPLAALALSGIAWAAWTATGTGTGTAKSTTSKQTSTVAPGTSVADLFPGAAKTVTVTVTNNEDYPAFVSYIPRVDSVLVNTSCAAGSVFTVARGTAGGTTALTPVSGTSTIPAGGSRDYLIDTRMIGTADEACKSQTFSLAYDSTHKVELLSDATTAP